MTNVVLPKIKFDGVDEETRREIVAFLFALEIIRQEGTGHGTIIIEVKEGRAADMKAEHIIRPKYLKLQE
jgi:hypothetical protein